MNNDYINNHSSMSSNKYIANFNQKFPQLSRHIQESYIKNQNKGILDINSKGNRNIFFDSDNERKPSNQKDLLISKAVSKYPANYAPGPNPYNDGVVKGYYINYKGEPKFNNKTYQIPLREIEDERNEEYQRRNYYRDNEEDNGGEEDNEEDDEMEMENGNEYGDISPQKAVGEYNEYNDYIGDGIVRNNNIPNYSPNQNGQNQNIPYYQKKNLNYYNNNNYNRNYGQYDENQMDNENQNIEEEEDDGQYLIESPTKTYNYNKRQPYQRRRIMGNLGDSASSEAYANNNKNIQRTPIIENNSRIYVKPKPRNNNVTGISTEERGIESIRDSTNNANNMNYSRIKNKKPYQYIDTEENDVNKYNKNNNYDEDSLNVVEPPIYNYPNIDRDKGGKVDLNFGIIKNRTKRDENKSKEKEEIENELEDENEDNNDDDDDKMFEMSIIKIQAFWRGRSTRKIMNLYHDLDEFIYLLSKVHFNHFSDNFYFFINQLFNVYKANTLENQIDSLDEENEKDDDEKNDKNDEKNNEEKNEDNNNNDDNNNNVNSDENLNNKNYDQLLNDYNNLQKKYEELIKGEKPDKTDYKTSTKKSSLLNNNNNNDILSVPGETTIGTIKTDYKFKKKNKLNPNNENLTFSNDYNDEVEVNKNDYDRHYYTPNQEEEDSFNDGSKEKRFSYSSIHSEENSKYFDNEQPVKGSTSGKRNISLKNKGIKNPKVGILSLNKKKDKIFSCSPSIEFEKSRGNSTKRYLNNSQNDNRITNISIIPKHEEELEIIKSPMDVDKNIFNQDILDPKKLEEDAYDKYKNNYSKDLVIVKNNKINYEKSNQNKDNNENIVKKLKYFDKDFIYPENENNLEIIDPKKSDEQKMKDILKNEKLLEKIKDKLGNKINTKNVKKPKLIQKYGDSFIIKGKKPINKKEKNNLDKLNNEIETNINIEIIQNNHRNFSLKILDFDSNELFLGGNNTLLKKKRLKNIIPKNENELFFEKSNNKNISLFSKEKILPSFINNENNGFTIKNNIPKIETKQNNRFNEDNIIIDYIYNNEFTINESTLKKDKDKEKDKEKEKEVIIIPSRENKFIRLRRSKRTKETYFTIKSNNNNNKKDKDKEKEKEENKLIRIKGDHFVIKSEYYYVETKDNPLPDIIEKKVKETIIIDNSNNKNEFKFNKDKTKYIIENEFKIEADKNKNKYFEDIEKNELTIFSNIKNKKSKNKKNINENKIEEFTINGDKKKWNELEFIPNEDFMISNDFYINDNNNDNNSNKDNILFDIETNELQIITKHKKLKSNISEKILKDNINKINNNITSKENDINLNGEIKKTEDKEVQIDPIREVKITTKKILKAEKIKRKRFINNKETNENSICINGIISNNNTINNNERKSLLVIEPNNQLTFKKQKIKKYKKEDNINKEFNDLEIIFNNNFNIKRKKNKTKEEETEITNELINNQNNIDNNVIDSNIKDNIGKKKKIKMKEIETQTESNNNNLFNNVNSINKIDNINLEYRNRAFPKLDMNKCLEQIFNGKEKNILNDNKEFYIENNEITILKNKKKLNKEEIKKDDDNIIRKENKNKKIKMKESETETDNDLYNIIPENNNEITIESSLPITSSIKENKLFNNLKINKCNENIFNGKEKDKDYYIELNNSIMIKKNKKKESIKNEEQNKDNKEEEESNKLKSKKKENEKDNYLIESNELIIKGLKRRKSALKQLKEEKKEEINYLPTIKQKEEENNKLFNNLDKNKIIEETFNGKEKEPIIFKNIKNEEITLNSKYKKKKKTKEMETQMDINDLNSNLIFDNNNNNKFTIKPIKKENIIVINKQFNIKDNINNNKKDLKNSELKKEFNNLEVSYSESLAIITKEEYEKDEQEPDTILSKKFNKLLNSDNENANSELNNNMIENLIVTNEKQLEILSNIKRPENIGEEKDNKINKDENLIINKNDLDTNFTKDFIDNMVQDRLEKEKQKNMDNTKDKLFKVLKAIKLKNALNKNINNKKYFMDKLKELKKIKDEEYKNKKKLSPENAFNYNYLSKNEKIEASTNTDNLGEINDKTNQNIKDKDKDKEKNNDLEIGYNSQFTINKKKKKLNENETEITEELNKIEPIQNYEFSLINTKKKDNYDDESIENDGKSPKRIIHRKYRSVQMSPKAFSETKENDLNISGISKDTVDKEVQIDPIKEFKITTKKILKKETLSKKRFLNNKSLNADTFSIISTQNKKEDIKKKEIEKCDECTQTPKLRPANKAPKKVVFHEIKTIIKKEQKPINKYEINKITNFEFIGKEKKNLRNNKIPKETTENEEDNAPKDCNKIFRIEKLKNLLNIYNNKRINTLQLIYFIKWKYLSNKEEKTEDDKNAENIIKKKILLKYPKIFSMKLLNFFDQYAKYLSFQEGINKIKNIKNEKVFKLFKKHYLKKKKRGKKNKKKDSKTELDKTKLGLEKLNDILKKKAGIKIATYLIELYKKEK